MTDPGVVCAVDVGSTFIKASVYDADLRVLAHARRAFPARRHEGRAEADPRLMWQAFTATVRAAVSAAAHPPRVLVLSAQMAGLVLLDVRWQPLGPVILGVDRRGDEVATDPRTGCPSGAIYPVGKLAWLGRHEPSRAAATRHVGGVKEYLLHRLTAAWVTEPSSASTTGLYDVTAGRWWDDAVRHAHIEPEYLPRLVRPRDRVGVLTPPAAAECGIPAGTAVLAGLGDGPAANLACGAVGARLCLSLGTTVVVRLLVRGLELPESPVPLFVQHVDGDWHCVGVRLDPAGGRYPPVGAPETRLDPDSARYSPVGAPGSLLTLDELPLALQPLLRHYRVSELRPTGTASRDTGLLHRLAGAWALPVRVTDAYDGTRGVAVLARDDLDDLATAAERAPVTADIQPEGRCFR